MERTFIAILLQCFCQVATLEVTRQLTPQITPVVGTVVM